MGSSSTEIIHKCRVYRYAAYRWWRNFVCELTILIMWMCIYGLGNRSVWSLTKAKDFFAKIGDACIIPQYQCNQLHQQMSTPLWRSNIWWKGTCDHPRKKICFPLYDGCSCICGYRRNVPWKQPWQVYPKIMTWRFCSCNIEYLSWTQAVNKTNNTM